MLTDCSDGDAAICDLHGEIRRTIEHLVSRLSISALNNSCSLELFEHGAGPLDFIKDLQPLRPSIYKGGDWHCVLTR